MRIRSLTKHVPISVIADHLAFETGKPAAAMLARDSRQMTRWHRAAVIWLAWEAGGHSIDSIAAALGRCTKTVRTALREAQFLRLMDQNFRDLTSAVETLLPLAVAHIPGAHYGYSRLPA